jgi:hypothetical protein
MKISIKTESIPFANVDDNTLAKMFFDLRMTDTEEYKLMKTIVKRLLINNKLYLLTNVQYK